MLPQIKIWNILSTLLLGGASAALAYLLGVPAPWLTGPAFFVSLAGIWGMKLHMPDFIRNGVFVIIGMTMGAGVTPETVATAAQWPLSILILFISLTIILLVCNNLLRDHFGYDRETAFLSSAPGHLSYVLSLSTDTHANIPIISIIQTMRVLTLTLAVPILVGFYYPEHISNMSFPGEPMSLIGLMIIALFSIIVGYGFQKLRVPAALLMGGLCVSSFFHLSEWVTGIVPSWLTIPAFIFMGTLIGTRFNGVSLALIKSALKASIASTTITLILAAFAATLVSLFIDVPYTHLLIAFAPGGLETMAAMGIMLGANPAFIAAHHVLRILFLTAIIPLLLHFQKRPS